MTEQTITNEEIVAANLEAASSGLLTGETVQVNPEEPNATDDAAVSIENAGAVGSAEPVVVESQIVPTTGGEVPTEPLLIATVSVFRSRYDGQFFIKANTGEGYSAPNASTAGHVASNLVATIVQESINSKFEYAVGAA
jgi:hypothetical protein